MELNMIDEAAEALATADWVLVAAGAGFSADSGLPTYEDCLNQGVDYQQLCRPELLYEDPKLAFGWWGDSVRRYRETPAHEGYDILDGLLQRHREKGRVYVYTSNVDGHFRSATALPVFEVHGRCTEWMCSSRLAYRASELARYGEPDPVARDVPIEGLRWSRVRERQKLLSERFGSCNPCLDPSPMVVPDGWKPALDEHMPVRASLTEGYDEGDKPLADSGHQRYEHVAADWNHTPPLCRCGLPLRPCVLMFADEDAALLRRLREGEDRYQRWEESMEEDLAACRGRLAILELGCGTRVQSIRQECEMVLRDAAARGARVTLIRINPSTDPSFDGFLAPSGCADTSDVGCSVAADGTAGEGRLVRIRLGALDALQTLKGAVYAKRSS
mmetsp:Transcript_40483/g.106906  ORF Transcript_40483/g.106906 Transcript_40483/m.106906 type:complete len:388 (-) Transcript_40483:57-1220(-)